MTSNNEETAGGGWWLRLRQLMHWATGDRSAEGKALSERAGPEVSDEDATIAVRRAHGDLGVPDETVPELASETNLDDFAEPQDAQAEHEDRTPG